MCKTKAKSQDYEINLKLINESSLGQDLFIYLFIFTNIILFSDTHTSTPHRGLTLLAPFLLGAVDVVFELDANLPLVGLIPDEGMFEQLLGGRALSVVLHQAALDEAEELLGPVRVKGAMTLCSFNIKDVLTDRKKF